MRLRTSKTPSPPGDILEKDHRELDALLTSAIEAIHGGDLERSYSTVDVVWARLAMHIRAEHLHVFPAVLHLDVPDHSIECVALLARLRSDHDLFIRDLGRAIKALRLAFNFGNVSETLRIAGRLVEGVRSGLEIHNDIEEGHVYTLLESAFFDPDSLTVLAAGITKELENYPQRFDRLSRPK